MSAVICHQADGESPASSRTWLEIWRRRGLICPTRRQSNQCTDQAPRHLTGLRARPITRQKQGSSSVHHSSTLFHGHHAAGCKANHAMMTDAMRYDGKTWPPPDRRASTCFLLLFFVVFLMLSWGIFPFGLFPLFQCSRAFSGCLLCFHATTGNFHIQSPRSRPPPSSASSLGRHLAPPPRHQGSHGWETRPRDWIAFLDGQSRSAASLALLHPPYTTKP